MIKKQTSLAIMVFLGKLRFYWQRGYSTIAIFMSMFNFTILLYNFILKDSSLIPEKYNNFWICSGGLITVAIPLVILLGWKDFRKGTWRQEQIHAAENSPIWTKNFRIIERIEKKVDEMRTQG